MQISVRSYLTAGVSLTAASVIALTPLAIPANERAVNIPTVTVSDIQLTVTPADITAFFSQLESQLEVFNATIANVVGIPGQTLIEGLDQAIALNEQLFGALRSSTTNPTLLALFDALENNADWGLSDLAYNVDFANDAVVVTTQNLADLLTGTLTGSLSTVLAAVVDVANNPLSFAKYAGLLGAGVATGQLIGNNGIQVVRDLSDAGFDFASAGLWAVQDTINNAIWTVRDLNDVAAGATGSEIIEAVNYALQSILIAPVQLGINIPFGVTSDALDSLWEGIDDALVGAQGLVTITGTSLQQAIGAIGTGPLNPQSYLAATAVLAMGGFSAFNTTVQTVGDVAQVPFGLGSDITLGISDAVLDLNLEIAEAISGVLTAVGLPPEIAALTLVVAGQINAVVEAGAETVAGSFDVASGLIEDGTSLVIDASNAIEDSIFGIVPGAGAGANTALSAPEPASLKVAPEPAGAPAGDVTPPADETSDDKKADDVTNDETETDAGDGTTGADDSAGADDKAGSSTADRATDRADRAAKKAERRAKADSGSDNGGSDKSDSGSDNGGGSDE